MPRIIISDTSTLILFQKINELDLLKKVYNKIFVTPEIAAEFGEKLPEWIQLEKVADEKYQLFLKHRLIKVKQVQ